MGQSPAPPIPEGRADAETSGARATGGVQALCREGVHTKGCGDAVAEAETTANELIMIRQSLLVSCPHCRALVGQLCRRPSGRIYKPSHDSRLMKLQKARALRNSIGGAVVIGPANDFVSGY